MKLRLNIVRHMAITGHTICIGYCINSARASLAIVPQLAIGMLMPMPTNARNASVNIALGTISVVFTIIGPMQFTTRCLNSMWGLLAPITYAA